MGCHQSNLMDPVKEAISVFERKLLMERNWLLCEELFKLLKSCRPNVRRHFANYTPSQRLKFFQSRPTLFTVANGGYVWSNKTFDIVKAEKAQAKTTDDHMPVELHLKLSSALALLLKCHESLNVLDLKRIVAYVFDDVATALSALSPVRQDELLRNIPDVNVDYNTMRLVGRYPDTSHLTKDQKFLLLAVSLMAPTFMESCFHQTLVERVLELEPEELQTLSDMPTEWMMEYVKKMELLDVEEDGFVSLFEEFYRGLVEYDCLPPTATTTSREDLPLVAKSESKRVAESPEWLRKVKKTLRSRDVCQHLRLRPRRSNGEPDDKLQAAALYLLDVVSCMHPAEMAACIAYVMEDVLYYGLHKELERRLKASPLTYFDKFGFVGLHSHYELPESALSSKELFKLFVVGRLLVRGRAHYAVIEAELEKTLPLEIVFDLNSSSKLRKYERFSRYWRVEDDGTVKFPDNVIFSNKKVEVESYGSPLLDTLANCPKQPGDQQSSSDNVQGLPAPACSKMDDSFVQDVVHGLSFLASHFEVRSTLLLWRLFMRVFDTFRAHFSALIVRQQVEIVIAVYESFFIDANGIVSVKPAMSAADCNYLNDKTKQLLYFSYSLMDGRKIHYEELYKEYEQHVTEVAPTARSQSQKFKYFQRFPEVFSISVGGYVKLLPLPETELQALFFVVDTRDKKGIPKEAAKNPDVKPEKVDAEFKSELPSARDVFSKWSLKFESDVFGKLGSIESQDPFTFGLPRNDLVESKENASTEKILLAKSRTPVCSEDTKPSRKILKAVKKNHHTLIKGLEELKMHTASEVKSDLIHSDPIKSTRKLLKAARKNPNDTVKVPKASTGTVMQFKSDVLALRPEDIESFRKILKATKKYTEMNKSDFRLFEISTASTTDTKSHFSLSTVGSEGNSLETSYKVSESNKSYIEIPAGKTMTDVQTENNFNESAADGISSSSLGSEDSSRETSKKVSVNNKCLLRMPVVKISTAARLGLQSLTRSYSTQGFEDNFLPKSLEKASESNKSSMKVPMIKTTTAVQTENNWTESIPKVISISRFTVGSTGNSPPKTSKKGSVSNKSIQKINVVKTTNAVQTEKKLDESATEGISSLTQESGDNSFAKTSKKIPESEKSNFKVPVAIKSTAVQIGVEDKTRNFSTEGSKDNSPKTSERVSESNRSNMKTAVPNENGLNKSTAEDILRDDVLTKKESSKNTSSNEESKRAASSGKAEREIVEIPKAASSKGKGDCPKPKNKLLEKKLLDDEMSLKVTHSLTYIVTHFEAVDSIPQLFALVLQIFSKIQTYFFGLTLPDQVYFVRKCYLPFAIDTNGLLSLKKGGQPSKLDLSDQEKQMLFFSYHLCRSGRTDFLKLFSDFSKQARLPSKMSRNEKFCYFRKTANIFTVSNDGDVDLVPLPKLELGIVFFSNMYSDDTLPAVEAAAASGKKSRCRSKSKGGRNRSVSTSVATKGSGTDRSKSCEAKIASETTHCASVDDEGLDGSASVRRSGDEKADTRSSWHDDSDHSSRSPMSASNVSRSRPTCRKTSDRKPSVVRIRDSVCFLVQTFRVRSDSNFLDVVFHILNENKRFLEMVCADRLLLVRQCLAPFCVGRDNVIHVHPQKAFAVEQLTEQEKDWLFIAQVLNDLGEVHFDQVFKKFEEHGRVVPSNLVTYSDKFYYFLLLDKLFDLKEDGRVRLPDMPKLDIDVTLLLFSFSPLNLPTHDESKEQDGLEGPPSPKLSWYERSLSIEGSDESPVECSRNRSMSDTTDFFAKGSYSEFKKHRADSIIPMFTIEVPEGVQTRGVSSRSDAYVKKASNVPSSVVQPSATELNSSCSFRGISSAAACKNLLESDSSDEMMKKINKIKKANLISVINSHLKKNGVFTSKTENGTRSAKDKEVPKTKPVSVTNHQVVTGELKTLPVQKENKALVQTEVADKSFSSTSESISGRASRLDSWQVVQKRRRKKSKSVPPAEDRQTKPVVSKARPFNEYDIHRELRVKLNTAVDYLLQTFKVKISKNVVQVAFCAISNIRELFALLPNNTQTEVLKDVYKTFPENPNKVTSSTRTPGLNRVSLNDESKNSLIITHHLSLVTCNHYAKIFKMLRSHKPLPVTSETDSKAFQYFRDRDCFVIENDGYVRLSKFPPDELNHDHLFGSERKEPTRSLSRKRSRRRSRSGRSCSVSKNAKLPGSGLIVTVTGTPPKSKPSAVEQSQSNNGPKSPGDEQSQLGARPKSSAAVVVVESRSSENGTGEREEESESWSDEAYYTDEHPDNLKDKICSRISNGIRFLLNYHDSVSQLDAARIVLYVLSDVRVAFAKLLPLEQRAMFQQSFKQFVCGGDLLYAGTGPKKTPVAFDLSEEEKRMLLTVYLVYQNGAVRYEDVLNSFGVFGSNRPPSWPDKETFVAERRNHLRLDQAGLLTLFALPIVHLPKPSLPSRAPPGFEKAIASPPKPPSDDSAEDPDDIFYDFEPHQDPAMELQAISFFSNILDIYKSGRSVDMLQKYSATSLSTVQQYLTQCYDGDVEKFFVAHPVLFSVSPEGCVCLKKTGGNDR